MLARFAPLFALSALLLLPAGDAAAQAALGAAGEQHYLYRQAGELIGEEFFRFHEFGDTVLVDGITRIQVPSAREFRARTAFVRPDDRLLDYLLWTASGDSVRAWYSGDTLYGRRLTREGRDSRSYVLDGAKPMLLDNSVAHHLWLLARQLHRDPTGRQQLRVLIPQQLKALEIRRDAPIPRRGALDGKPIAVRSFGLRFAGLYFELDLDETGLLLAQRLPARNFEILRAGYEPGEAEPDPAELGQPELAVTIEGGGPPLDGVLTLPEEGSGPFPAVVLVHDVGLADQDFRVGPNRIFAQLAQALAERGIASVRYDKRTFVLDQGKDPEGGKEERKGVYDDGITLDEAVLDDAEAAFGLLGDHPRIDPARRFILGLGLGAAAAPGLNKRLEADGQGAAGLIMLAPPGRDVLTVVHEGFRFLHERGLVDDATMETYDRYVGDYHQGNLGENDVLFFAGVQYWDSVVFWRPTRDYDEQGAPALVLFGERDATILEADREVWAKHFAAHPRAGTEFELLPGLNHFFLPGEGEPDPAEFGRPGRIDARVLDRLEDWIGAR